MCRWGMRSLRRHVSLVFVQRSALGRLPFGCDGVTNFSFPDDEVARLELEPELG